MIRTTPAPERYTRFSCPNPHCAQCNRSGTGNIAHRAWTGKARHIERLRCTLCHREFSEREGTLMARSKLPETTVIQLLKCQRWGVCDEGTADICAVDLKPVHRFQRVAAHRAHTHHQQAVQQVDVTGVPMDEAHSKLRRRRTEWIHTAWAMGRGFLLWGDCGPRTQDTAATLRAQVVARVQTLPLFLTDGGKASPAALLQVVGVVYRRRRRGHVGRKPKPRVVAPTDLFYAQGVKVRDKTGQGWWRSAGAWSAVAHASLASSCVCANSERRSRQHVWNAGTAPCVGSSRPCGAAPGGCPGAARATGGRSGS